MISRPPVVDEKTSNQAWLAFGNIAVSICCHFFATTLDFTFSVPFRFAPTFYNLAASDMTLAG